MRKNDPAFAKEILGDLFIHRPNNLVKILKELNAACLTRDNIKAGTASQLPINIIKDGTN